jgi:hypothetical protein
MSQHANGRDAMKQKRDLVHDIFGQKLAHRDLIEAYRICTEDFDDDHEFTASDFCQRLATTRPEVSIGKQTRLLFLRGVRQHSVGAEPRHKQETSRRTHVVSADHRGSSGSARSSMPERRHHPRKTTDLMGVYWHHLDRHQTGALIVENLSLGGCGIRILTPHELKRGEMLRLEFKLDNASETFLRIRGQLRWVLYDLAGIEFHSSYTMPQVLMDYINS